MDQEKPLIQHNHDTFLSSVFRFAVEMIAWIAAPWAVSTLSTWLVLPTLLLLVGLPAVFSTPHDKRVIIVPTPGAIRIMIECFIYAVAAIAPWFIWREIWCMSVLGIVGISLILGIPRYRWLISQ